MKRLLKFFMSRVVIVALLILAQFVIIALSMFVFFEYFALYYTLATLLSIVVVCRIVSKRDNPSYKMAWIILVLILPPFGVAVYIIFKGNKLSPKKIRQMEGMNHAPLTSAPEYTKHISDNFTDLSAKKQSDYITNSASCPPYQNTGITYFASGEEFFPVMLEELKKAEKYIFLEYFIIDRGEMWDKIHKILLDKAARGVDVRIIYDDMGCINHLDTGFNRFLESEGIRCHVFNRFIPVLSARLNNRNHRKICAVDGKIAFTGGVNIADEYINKIERYGYWKDNALMLEGDAAWSMTVMFLAMWDTLDKEDSEKEDYSKYLPDTLGKTKKNLLGIVQPYTDNPMDNRPVGETIYLNMLYSAKKYVWITTPYLIIDYTMEQALCTAAQSGVDVRIITPGTPDKRIVYEATKSTYKGLIEAGVKIYEYSPGFIHAKTFICDDKYATVGSVNLDFRSLYLHFECGVWMYDSPAIFDVKSDYEETLTQCHEISEEDCKVGVVRSAVRSVLALMAPLI